MERLSSARLVMGWLRMGPLLAACAACGRADGEATSTPGDAAGAPSSSVDVTGGDAAGGDGPAEQVEGAGSTQPCLPEVAIELIESAAANSPRACTLDSDCIVYGRRPECVYDCGYRAAVTDGSAIDAAIDRVDAELCPAHCIFEPASCGGLLVGVAYAAVCEGGQCQLLESHWGSD